MANKKITELPFGTTPTGSELAEGVQGGVNKQFTFQDIANLSTGTVVAAALSDMVAGSSNTLTVTPKALEDYRSILRASCSVSGGTMTLNMTSHREICFEATTAISSDFILASSNSTNIELFSVVIPITGTVDITMPSSVVTNLIEYRWDNSTKILTLVGSTSSPFEISFKKISSSRYLMIASQAYYAS